MGVTKMKTQIVPYQKNSILERMHGKTRGGISAGLAISKTILYSFC